MALTPADKRWITKKIKSLIEDSLKDVVSLGGYDGATLVIDADMYEHALNKPTPNRIGFHTAGQESTT